MRPIDADQLFDFLTDRLDKETGAYSRGKNTGIHIVRSALHDLAITPTIVFSSNDPLTLEDLREMDGEPVFCLSSKCENDSAYGIVIMRDKTPYVRTFVDRGKSSRFFYLASLGSSWQAYRRKPEEDAP